jgi:hypothetical protein
MGSDHLLNLRTKAERNKPAMRYLKHLRQLLQLSPSACTSSLLCELQKPSVHERRLKFCIDTWLCLRVTSIKMFYLTVQLSTSVLPLVFGRAAMLTRVRFPKTAFEAVRILSSIDQSFVFAASNALQQSSEEVSCSDPRWCPCKLKGASACTYAYYSTGCGLSATQIN